jgi:hypothetical protein
MTVGAVHRSCSLTGAMPLWIDICVAFHAGDVPVFRILQLFFLDGQRDLFTLYRLENIVCFMTFQAFPIRRSKDQAGSTDRVRPVTICTGRNCAGFCLPEFTSYDFGVDLFDSGMTLGAGSGYIFCRDRGISICVGENEVISVAIIACGGYDQALFEQAFSMDTLGVVAQDISFRNVIYPCHRRTLSVAFSAQDRNVHFICLRSDVRRRQDVVFPVAFIAGRGIGSASSQGSSVNTCIKLLIGNIMTHPTVHSFQIFRVRVFFHIGILVAVDAIRIFVHRFRKSYKIHVQRNGPSLSS